MLKGVLLAALLLASTAASAQTGPWYDGDGSHGYLVVFQFRATPAEGNVEDTGKPHWHVLHSIVKWHDMGTCERALQRDIEDIQAEILPQVDQDREEGYSIDEMSLACRPLPEDKLPDGYTPSWAEEPNA